MVNLTQLAIAPAYEFPKRPPLRYFGGKWRLAKWIVNQFPAHVRYITPYGGGWCESFQKTRAGDLEVYNDLNCYNVNFFNILQSDPARLIDAIEHSPRTRKEFLASREPSDDPIEQARRYYLYCHLSVMGGGGPIYSGTSDARLALRAIHDDSHLWPAHHRIKDVAIEQLDALDCIDKYDHVDALFYCDPGYPKESLAEGDRTWYLHHTSTEEHIQLAKTLNSIKGKAVVSGYDCALYQEIFSGWEKLERSTVTMSRRNAVECLWIKP